MESDQNQVDLSTPVSCTDKESNSVSSPLNHDAKSPTMLENMSIDEEMVSPRKEILRREDATQSKLDEMMDKLLEILDETITIFESDAGQDDDNDIYILSEPKIPNEPVVDDVIIVKKKSEGNQSVGCQTEADGDSVGLAVSKNQNETHSELAESIMLALMLFCLYFVLYPR